MIKLNGFKDNYTIDLNETPYEEYNIDVESSDDEGKFSIWGISYVSSEGISSDVMGKSSLSLKFDLDEICSDSSVVLVNAEGDSAKILVKPNVEAISEKTYVFKCEKTSQKDNKIWIRITSSENGKPCPWRCTFNGRPLNFKITPFESNGKDDEEIYIELNSKVNGVIASCIEFTQDKSYNAIRIGLIQTNDEPIKVTNILTIQE